MVYTQILGLAIAGVWVAVSGESAPPLRSLAAAAGAGIGLTVSIAGFFQAMVVGSISIVAPITATGVALPIVIGVAQGERPGIAQVVGIVAAVAGTMLAAKPSTAESLNETPGVGLALLGALGLGIYFWLMEPASRHGVAWAMLILTAVAVASIVPVALVRRGSSRTAITRRSAGAILTAAILSFLAQALYGFATRHGQLAVVSVLAALYPAVTVLMALVVLRERIYGLQLLGVAAVLTGILLLSV